MQVPQIHRIQIENFRRIREPLDLDLTTPRGEAVEQAVLAGPNGCGKTSVLEAVILALGQGALISRNLPAEDRTDHWRVQLPPDSKIVVHGRMFQTTDVIWEVKNQSCTVRLAANGATGGVPPEPLWVEYFSSWREPALVGAVNPLVGTGKRPGDTERNRLWRLKQRIGDERARAGFAANSTEPTKADEWLARLNEAWSTLHSNDGTRIDVQIVAPKAEDLLSDLFVVDQAGNRICSVDQTSSGEIEMLSLMGLLILNDFHGGLLVIDEPELHLHPQWQTALLPAMRKLAPTAQFLVATHSDAIWEQTPRSSRFLLVPESDSRSEAWRERHQVDGHEGAP